MRANTSLNYLLLLLLLFYFPPPATSSYSPPDNYLLACGASASVPLPDGRLFLPDFPFLSSSRHRHHLSTPLSLPSSFPSSPLSASARLFSHSISFSFPLRSLGPHFLRLHFLPSPSLPSLSPLNLSLSGSSPLSLFDSPSDLPSLKEFLFDPSPLSFLTLSLSPSSTAFINAIELISVPAAIFPNPFSEGFSDHVLETLHRINVGGPKVTPANDTLWRSWVPDEGFLVAGSHALALDFSGMVHYPEGGATPETAPESVYRTGRVMHRGENRSASLVVNGLNITWVCPVILANSSLGFLMRLHFCDIVSKSLNELYFDVYVDGDLAYKDLDLSSLAGYALATPYYVDYFVRSRGSGSLRVSLRPSERSLPWKANAILNGIEIMRVAGVTSFPEKIQEKRHDLAVLVGFVLGGVLFVCLLVLLVLVVVHGCKRRKNRKQRPQLQDNAPTAWSSLPVYAGSSYSRLTELTTGSPATNLNLQLRIPFSDVLLATNNFDKKSQIGSGGFGKVYKGVLRDGTKVAVKRGVRGSRQGLPEFQTEIVVLTKIRHRHLVSLIGFCQEQSEMILVYEFMEKGPLRDHLYGSGCRFLSWKQRLDVCIGAARGLHYLHTGSTEGIIHRDVKSSNILLDEKYVAKVADFGLSRLGTQNQNHVSTGVKGSFGYLDPEYFRTQQLTEKSDVYSFGVVLLEVLCARPAIEPHLSWEQVNLAEWAMKWQKKGLLDRIVDPLLKDKIDATSLRKFGEVAEKCLSQYGVDRPAMGDVLWNLEYVLQLHESAMRREPYEDSAVGTSEVQLPSV